MVKLETDLLPADGIEDGLGVAFAFEYGFPGVDLLRAVQVTVGELRELAPEDFRKKVAAAGDFPRIELFLQLFAAVPEVVSLFLVLARPDRMRRDRERALRADGAGKVADVAVGRDELRDADAEDVGGAVIGDGVLGELKARDDHHAVHPHCALGFGAQDLEVEREGGRRKRPVEIVGSAADQCGRFAEVIGDGDGAKSASTVEIHELGDRELSVAEGGMHVHIREEHVVSIG